TAWMPTIQAEFGRTWGQVRSSCMYVGLRLGFRLLQDAPGVTAWMPTIQAEFGRTWGQVRSSCMYVGLRLGFRL
ncbi:hypothetical protein CP989_25915, partial [Enterobacter hormaechei]